jgi:hypothetical protein
VWVRVWAGVLVCGWVGGCACVCVWACVCVNVRVCVFVSGGFNGQTPPRGGLWIRIDG